MTSEERLNRLERIARLMVRVGLRARRQTREQNDKIDIIIDSQIKNEERFAKLADSQGELALTQAEQGDKINIIIAAQIKNEERFARNEERFAQNEERFAKMAEAQTELAQAQAHTDRRLDALIDIIREGRNGKPDS